VLGPNHPDTALALNNLAGIHFQQGNFAEARSLFEQALAILTRTLGPEHRRVLAVQANIGVLTEAWEKRASSNRIDDNEPK
jgi:tetratricopeptide (TPR) repeat protein